MMKIKAMCGQTILQHEAIHNTMSYVNIEQSRVGRKKHPIPNIKDLYAKLTGDKLYSRIDLRNAY